jgi:hypothetical protein
MRRKVEAAFDLDGILRGIRKAELDSGGALAIVKALKERGRIDIGAVPAGKGSVDFAGFLSGFFDHDKSAYSMPNNRDFLHKYAKNQQVQQAAMAARQPGGECRSQRRTPPGWKSGRGVWVNSCYA